MLHGEAGGAGRGDVLADLAVGQAGRLAARRLDHREAFDVDAAEGAQRGQEAEVVEDLGARRVDELSGEARLVALARLQDQHAACAIGQRRRHRAPGHARADDDHICGEGCVRRSGRCSRSWVVAMRDRLHDRLLWAENYHAQRREIGGFPTVRRRTSDGVALVLRRTHGCANPHGLPRAERGCVPPQPSASRCTPVPRGVPNGTGALRPQPRPGPAETGGPGAEHGPGHPGPSGSGPRGIVRLWPRIRTRTALCL